MSESAQATSEARKKPRSWYRLHVSTICMLVPAAAVLVLLVVPGDVVEKWSVNVGVSWRTERTFEHGWPWVCLRRTATWPRGAEPEYPVSGIPWLFRSAWSFQGDGREFRPWVLALDILVGLVVLSLVAAAAEWRRRRHRRIWQFSVAEMLTVTCLVAAGLAWYQYNKQVYQHEMKIASAGDQPDRRRADFVLTRYRGPVWLRKLAGEWNLRWLHRVTRVELGGEQLGDEDLKRRVEQMKTLSSLESLAIGTSRVTDAGSSVCHSFAPCVSSISLKPTRRAPD
ncbi:MAG: hypothetical protein ACYTG0_02825 [Planctomycetota bacterium]|jgi:hypothetical protein